MDGDCEPEEAMGLLRAPQQVVLGAVQGAGGEKTQ